MNEAVWVAMGAGAGAATVLVASLAWLFGPRIEKLVVGCIRENHAVIREALNLDQVDEKLRTNAHSITGLRGLVTTQEEQLKRVVDVQPAIVRLTELVGEMSRNVAGVNDKLYDLGRESGNILGLLNQRIGEK